MAKYLKEKEFNEFCEFLKRNRDRNVLDLLHYSSKYDKYILGKVKDINIEYFDASDDPYNKVIIECAETDDIRDIYISSCLRVLIGNVDTLKKLSEMCDRISYQKYSSGVLMSSLELLYRNSDKFYGSEYMPLLIRAKNYEEKVKKTMSIFDKVLSFSSTIRLEKSSYAVFKSLSQISGIGDFYINRIIFMLNVFSDKLEEDYVALGPGSSYSLKLICGVSPKNQKATLFLLRELQEELNVSGIEMKISNIENSLCEFQKCYRKEHGIYNAF